MIEDKKSDRRYKKKRRLKGYWKFLAIYSGVLAGLIVIGLIWVYGLLGAYEKGMPDVAMDNIIRTQFSSENIDNLVNQNAGEVSPYEDVDNVRKYLENTINGNLTFARKSGEYTNDSPVYLVKSDDKNIAKVSLKETGKNRRGFSVWAVDAVTFGEFLGKDNAITITAPSDAVVTINGKQAGEDIIRKQDVPVEIAKNVGDYVKVPCNNVYRIEGLMAEPEITAVLNGRQLELKKDDSADGTYTAAYPSDDELLAGQSDNIKNINIEYGKYIINKGSLTRLKSYMTGNAKKYVSDIPAVWAFLWGKNYTYEFKSNEISNFVKYSDDCFSCDVHFDSYVNWNTGDKTYDTNLSYVFVKQSGKWYLADFAIK